jgi:hypothetical protein
MINRTARDNFVTITSDVVLVDDQLAIEIERALRQLGIREIKIKILRENGYSVIVRDLDVLRVSRNKQG